MRRRVDWRVRLVVFLAVARALEAVVVEQTGQERRVRIVVRRRAKREEKERTGALVRKLAPASVARVLLDELVKVKVAVKLVRLGTRVAENTALVQGLGDLGVGGSASVEAGAVSETARTGAHLEHSLRGHAQETRARLLQLDRRQRERFPAGAFGEGGQHDSRGREAARHGARTTSASAWSPILLRSLLRRPRRSRRPPRRCPGRTVDPGAT